MALQAGRFRHRVTIQQPALVQNPVTGEMTKGWENVATVYASVEPLSAKEYIAAQAQQSQITARVVIRYRAGLYATMRILHRDQIYNIEGVLADAKSGLEYLTLPVSAGVNGG